MSRLVSAFAILREILYNSRTGRGISLRSLIPKTSAYYHPPVSFNLSRIPGDSYFPSIPLRLIETTEVEQSRYANSLVALIRGIRLTLSYPTMKNLSKASQILLLLPLFFTGCLRTGMNVNWGTLPEDRPEFYDPNNMVEYYGKCPECNKWVTGYITHWSAEDTGGSGIIGKCPISNTYLHQDTSKKTDHERIIVWKQPEN